MAGVNEDAIEERPLEPLRLEDGSAAPSSIHRGDRTVHTAVLGVSLHSDGEWSPSPAASSTVATGFTPISDSPWDWLRSAILPSIALGTSSSAAIARQVRSAMVGVLQQDYIRAARAQGLSTRRVIFKHALTNAMVPVVAVLSFQITVLLGGALVVEQVFAINGLGTLAIGAVRQQDIPMIQGLVLVMVALVVIVQLITDVIYGLLNPKARPS